MTQLKNREQGEQSEGGFGVGGAPPELRYLSDDDLHFAAAFSEDSLRRKKAEDLILRRLRETCSCGRYRCGRNHELRLFCSTK